MRITTAGLAVLVTVAVAACGGSASTTANGGGSGGESASGSSPTTRTVTRSATAGASSAADDATGSSGAAPACVAAGLSLSFLGQQGATGHGELGFALRNTGAARCSTVGYPGVQFFAGGAPLPTTPTRTTSDFFGHTRLRMLTVAPGQTVSFRLGVTHGEGSSAGCSTADALEVIAPNDTATLTTAIPSGASECATATVSPLQAGAAAYP